MSQATARAPTGWDRFRSMLEQEWRPQQKVEHSLVRNPELLFRPLGWQPDPWQIEVIRSTAQQQLICIPRQCGKSTTVSAKALVVALTRPKALVSIVSRSQDQASEVLRKVKEFHGAWQEGLTVKSKPWEPKHLRLLEAAERELEAQATEAVSNSVMSLELGNGSRIRSMACSANTTVGYTNDLLILDEASRIPDAVYLPLRPTLAIARSRGKGQLLVPSTPNGKRGWFWEAWSKCLEAKARGERPAWETTTIKVEECPRITAEFLRDEVEEMGLRWYQQEYECVFGDAIGAVFRDEDIRRAMRVVDDCPPLEEDV